jgi:FtsH-binding integral membrane protein
MGVMPIFELIVKKRQFFILLFSNLLVQLGITYWVMEHTTNIKNKWPIIIAIFVILFIMLLVPMPPIMKFILFCIFSSLFGMIFSLLKQTKGEQIIQLGIKGALTIFGLMFALGIGSIVSGINLGYKTGSILFWLLLMLILARLVFVSGLQIANANKYLSYIGLLIFAGYVVYDTNIILQRNYNGDFIEASMDYYLDILNLFTNTIGANE